MGLFEHLPYTNFHDLNLDWILEKVKYAYEQVIKNGQDLEEFKKYVEDFYVSLDDLYIELKKLGLDEGGNFTGELDGKPVSCVLESIADALTLCKRLIDLINHRESIGDVYDGGAFTDTDPAANTIDGGTFFTTKVIENYDVNCIRPDFEIGAY